MIRLNISTVTVFVVCLFVFLVVVILQINFYSTTIKTLNSENADIPARYLTNCFIWIFTVLDSCSMSKITHSLISLVPLIHYGLLETCWIELRNNLF